MSAADIAALMLYITVVSAYTENDIWTDDGYWILVKKVNSLEQISGKKNAKWFDVVARKPASQSTKHAHYNASNAVNGNFTDFTHTAWPSMERSPWLRMDFGKIYRIHEIEIFNRKDCCGERLHDFDVKVGINFDEMVKVGHYTGPARKGERIMFLLPNNHKARYIQIQIKKGQKNILSVAELKVWGSDL